MLNNIPHKLSGFLTNLASILDSQLYTDIIAWNHYGDCFMLENPKRLELEVLRKYFKFRRLKVFLKELASFQFKKTYGKNNNTIFEHPNFKRGNYLLMLEMKRGKQQEEVEVQDEGLVGLTRLKESIMNEIGQFKQGEDFNDKLLTQLLHLNDSLRQQHEYLIGKVILYQCELDKKYDNVYNLVAQICRQQQQSSEDVGQFLKLDLATGEPTSAQLIE